MSDRGARALAERLGALHHERYNTSDGQLVKGILGTTGLFIADEEDFRDQHERAMRDHILETPTAHVCDDLCSDHIVNRLLDHIGAGS